MNFEVNVDASSVYPVITLKDTTTKCEAEVYAFGGLLNAFKIPVQGKSVNVIDAFSSPEDAAKNITNGCKSARLSPFVCRMNKGKYSFENIDYQIEKFFIGIHAIHGVTFDAVYEVKDVFADEHQASVTLHHHYPGTDKGYPFPYDVTLKWKLEKGNKVTVRSAVHHANKQSIPYAEGWHPYFNLGTDVNECTLQFDSDTQMEFDDTLLPTGNRLKDERFTQGALLNDTFLDNCFELNKTAHPKCVLINDLLELTLQPESSYPYLQIYTPDHRKSIAIENLSSIPDSFNNGIGIKYLEPHHVYNFTTSYILKAK